MVLEDGGFEAHVVVDCGDEVGGAQGVVGTGVGGEEL